MREIDLFTISADEVSDAYATGNYEVLEHIIAQSRETLARGGKVQYVQKYDNAPSDLQATFDTVQSFETWVASQNKMLAALNKPRVGKE